MLPHEPIDPKDAVLLQGILTIIIAVLTLVAWIFSPEPALPQVLGGMTVFCAVITGALHWDNLRQERKKNRASDEK